MKFKGKIAAWWYIFLLLGNAICIWVIFSKQTFWGILGGAIACIMFDVLFVPTIINNYVELRNSTLQIVFGLSSQSIPYRDISLIAESRNPMMSTAASLDRLYIMYEGGSVMVSVREKDAFIKELLRYNNKIQYIKK